MAAEHVAGGVAGAVGGGVTGFNAGVAVAPFLAFIPVIGPVLAVLAPPLLAKVGVAAGAAIGTNNPTAGVMIGLGGAGGLPTTPGSGV